MTRAGFEPYTMPLDNNEVRGVRSSKTSSSGARAWAAMASPSVNICLFCLDRKLRLLLGFHMRYQKVNSAHGKGKKNVIYDSGGI